MAEVPATTFKSLSSDPEWKDKLQFATPSLLQVFYVELNNRDSILADVRIRQALAYAIDYNGILNTVMQGFAKRTIGPIHPDKSYFDKDLKPIEQDLNRSLALIKEAGWKDTNGNGTPDKIIGGKKTELHLDIKITNKQEGTTIANIIKENAAKVGFDISIVILDPGQLQQDVKQQNFQLVPLRTSAYPGKDDPFPFWHSSTDRAGGNNRSGFHTPELDKILEDLRTTTDDPTRQADYKKFQEIIYTQQPAIYLYVPLERIIASKKVELQTSSRRPGYFENLLKPSGS
jgi:ABC-type transport system substrate-binding protein